jgi:hypothetical protein
MTVLLSPVGGVAAQFFDNNGNPLSGGKLYSYAAGTTTPAATYISSLGVTAHTNPIVLDSGGRVPGGEIWLTDGVIYKFVLETSTNVLIATYDNIVGINSNFVNYTTEQEIQTATAGQTVFNLTTTQYQPGTNSLSVYVDGVNQYGPGAQYAYLETDSDTVTFVSGLHVGASVKFTTATQTTGNATDASVVSYTPAGTGAVTTNVQTKLRQTCNAADYGFATTNTGAQNATALTNAFNAADIVQMSAGTYTINPFNIPENKSLVGQGSTNTVLQTSTSSNAITFDGAYNTQLHGFTLNQTGVVQGTGLYLIDQYFVTMIDVTVNGFQYGLYALQSIYHYIRECKFEGGQYGIYYGGTGSVWNVEWFNNVLTFENCRFNANTIIGSYVKGCEVVFLNCDWSLMTTNGAIGCKIEGVNAGNNAHGIQIIQPYAESTDIVFSFNYAFVEINGGFVQGGVAAGASAATSIIDVTNNSTVFWKSRPRDSDYWDFGYRVTNTSTLTFDVGFTQSVRASNTVDGTSAVNYVVTEVTPGTTAAAVASYNAAGLKRNYTDGVASVPTATPTNTGVLTNRIGTNVYMVSAVGFDASAAESIGGQAFVTIYNDGTTKRAAINSIATTRLTWSSIATDGTITFQHSATNATTITFNATQLN